MHKRNALNYASLVLLVVVIAALAGCQPAAGPVAPTAAPQATLAPNLQPAATSLPTSTALPTATFTLAPTFTPVPTATETALAATVTVSLPGEMVTATAGSVNATPVAPNGTASPSTGTASPSSGYVGGSGGLKVYLVALRTGGTVGCNDSVVPVSTGIPLTKDTATNIENALNALFNMKSKYYGSLYNPVSYSIFRVQQIDWSATTGHLNVWLSGKYKPSGDDCDNTRVKAQIWSTAKQFGGIVSTNFYINGPHPFGDFVSNDK